SITVQFEPYPDPVPETLYSACFDIPGTVVTLDAGSPDDQHSWITGSNERTIDVHDYGWYTVEITGYPDCTTLDSILVEEYCGPHIYLPNSFTPDGDGKNDKFGPVANEIHSVEFMV